MSDRSCRRTSRPCSPSWGRRDEGAVRHVAAYRRAGTRGFEPPAGRLGRPPASRRETGSPGQIADGAIALPRLPGPVDRRQRRRAGRGHAAPGPQPDRRRPAPRRGAPLAGPALWQLGQLPAAGRTGDLALVAGAAGAAGGRRLAGQGPAEEAQMTGYLILLVLAALALAGLRLLGLRGPLLTLAAAGSMLGAAGYA